MKTLDLAELEQWQREERRFVLIDVLPNHTPPDSSQPGMNRCRFMEHISNLGVPQDESVVLYETGSGMIKFDDAVVALSNSGFCELYHFLGPHAAFHSSQHRPLAQAGE